MDAERNPYRVLGVDPSADYEVIAAAYRVLARRHHPDVSQTADAERRMAEINAAWAILRDPETRGAWDREHSGAGRPAHGTAPETPPPAWRGASPSGTSGSGAEGPAQGPSQGWRSSRYGSGDTMQQTAAGRPQWRRGPHGQGAAGPPPGQPVGTVLPFGRHVGWSLGEVARVDPGYLSWLANRPDGAAYKTEIETILRGGYPSGSTGSGPLRGNRPRWSKPG